MKPAPPSSSDHPDTWKHGYPIYHAETSEQWAAWLAANHDTARGVWLATWRSSSERPRLEYDAVVEEALCWGWIDSTVNTLDDDRRLQLLTPRKPKSTWSRSNKERVERLRREGRMQPAGEAAIAAAEANGWWSILDDIEAGIEPDDLAAALDADPSARSNWDAFPQSARQQMLWWVKSAVKPQTRTNRIATIVTKAATGERAAG